jgi:hypothetical protein
MRLVSSSTDLTAYLHSLSRQTLVDLLVEQSEHNSRLRRELETRARERKHSGFGTESTIEPDVDSEAGYETSLEQDQPLSSARSSGYASASRMTPELGSVLAVTSDALRRLLDSGSKADLVPLARSTVNRLRQFAGQSGFSPTTRGELERALSLYARACALNPPDSTQLAQWIVDFAFENLPEQLNERWRLIDLSIFESSVGADGLDHIHGVVEAMLEKPQGVSEAKRVIAQDLLEQLAEIRGDVDALVAILAAKPSRWETNLKIVRVLRGAGRHAEAIAYAAKTLSQKAQPQKAQPSKAQSHKAQSPKTPPHKAMNSEGRLRKSSPDKAPAAQALAEKKSGNDLTEQIRPVSTQVAALAKKLQRNPIKEAYFELKEAVFAGVNVDDSRQNWVTVREKYLDIWESLGKESANRVEYLRLILAENLLDRALRFIQGADFLDLPTNLLVQLADAAESDHPEDMIRIQRVVIEKLISYKDVPHYRMAAQRLRKLRSLHKRQGSTEDFRSYLDQLLRVHQRKARLISEIRAARIALPKNSVTS